MQPGISADSAEEDTLAAALASNSVDLPSEQVELLDRFARLLWDWNTKLNLTRHTTYEKFVARDVVDAIAVADFLETGQQVLDVGTGGGLPGLILAILRPDVSMALCDSVGKKARTVAQIVAQLGLDVPVYNARAQDLLEEHPQDTLVARGVGRLEKLLGWLEPHWGQFGRLLLVKGPGWLDERREARERGMLRGLELRRRASYRPSGAESESVILEVRPKQG